MSTSRVWGRARTREPSAAVFKITNRSNVAAVSVSARVSAIHFFFPLQVFFYEKAQHRIELLKKPVGIPDARTSTAVHKGIQRTGSLLGRPSLRILLLPRASSSQPPRSLAQSLKAGGGHLTHIEGESGTWNWDHHTSQDPRRTFPRQKSRSRRRPAPVAQAITQKPLEASFSQPKLQRAAGDLP